MIKGALGVVLSFLSLCLPVAAQQPSHSELIRDQTPALIVYQPDMSGNVNSSMLIRDLPALSLLDGRYFPGSTAMSRMGMASLDVFPVALISAAERQRGDVSAIDPKDSPAELTEASRYYSSGEIGLSYGMSTGKSDYVEKQAYMIGTVGNDKFQITAGASYQESNGRIPRQGVFVPAR
jgi:hypothetical protein